MKLELTFSGASCYPCVFRINGIDAEDDEFGDKEDKAHEYAEEYGGCGNMQFESKPATKGVLDKYKITQEEYTEIANKLESGLSFGRCSQCV